MSQKFAAKVILGLNQPISCSKVLPQGVFLSQTFACKPKVILTSVLNKLIANSVARNKHSISVMQLFVYIKLSNIKVCIAVDAVFISLPKYKTHEIFVYNS